MYVPFDRALELMKENHNCMEEVVPTLPQRERKREREGERERELAVEGQSCVPHTFGSSTILFPTTTYTYIIVISTTALHIFLHCLTDSLSD